MFRTLSFLVPILIAQLPAQDAKLDPWVTDFAKAKATAKTDKKDLLIAFTGSDWCQPCMMLDEEVFAKSDFVATAPKSFVLVKLDNPRDETKITPAIKEQNQKLAEQYMIRGVPTVLLTDANGDVYAQTGYQPGGHEKYLELLGELQKKGVAFQKALAAVGDKQAGERAKALHEVLASLDEDVVHTHHLARMEEIVKLDADGKAGVKEKYEAKLKEITEAREIEREAKAMNELVAPLMEAGKGEEALAKVDAVIKAPKSKTQHQMAMFFKGMLTMDVKTDAKAAVEILEAGKALAPDSPIGKRIDEILPELKKQLGGKEQSEDEKKEGKKEGGK